MKKVISTENYGSLSYIVSFSSSEQQFLRRRNYKKKNIDLQSIFYNQIAINIFFSAKFSLNSYIYIFFNR